MKEATIALVVRLEGDQPKKPKLIDALSDDREIALFESALTMGETSPLDKVYEMRTQQHLEEEEFGNYVEELLARPFLRPEIREHGLQWLRSRMRIEEYQKTETEAARTISEYALKMYESNQELRDFSLAGATTVIRVRIFVLPPAAAMSQAA